MACKRNLSFFLLLLFPFALFASSHPEERHIHCALVLKEYEKALELARKWFSCSTPTSETYEIFIRCLASAGEEKEMMQTWEKFHAAFPEDSLKRELLEEICWGILENGKKASGTTTQLIALLGAGFAQDSRAVPFIHDGLQHSNARLRALAVKLSTLYRDDILCESIEKLYREEKRLEVREEILQAISELHLVSLLPSLLHEVADTKHGMEERKKAIKAALSLQDSLSKEQLQQLAKSPRAGLREFACVWIGRSEKKEHIDLIISLLKDPHPNVQVSALLALGLLRSDLSIDLHPFLESNNPLVSITAAWIALLEEKPEGKEILLKWIEKGNEEERVFAMGAVLAGGAHAVELASTLLQEKEGYIQANAAVALLRQRCEIEKSCQVIDQFMRNNHDRWTWTEGVFSALKKSDLLHNPVIANYPEVVNQTVRLELLNLLCIVDYPEAQESIKQFLKERRWGVTGLAAEVLLGEGDETALELVKDLLNDPDEKIRADAAFLLATWGHDSEVLPILEDLYLKGDRELKIKVLEALSRLEKGEAIPFLIQQLKQSSQTLRMMAACVLIRTLNH